MAREWPGQVTPVWLKVDVGNFGNYEYFGIS